MKRGRPKRHGTNRLSYAARAREEHGYRPDRMGRVGKACAWCNSALLSSSLLGARHNAEVILSLCFVLYRNAGEHKRNISTAYNSFTTKGQTLLRHAQRTIMYCAKGPCHLCRPPHKAEHRLRNTSRSQQRDNSPTAWHFLLNGCRKMHNSGANFWVCLPRSRVSAATTISWLSAENLERPPEHNVSLQAWRKELMYQP